MGSLARRLLYPSPSSLKNVTLAARARPRLSLLQRHLDSSPFELNTPFSTERASEPEIDVNHIRSPFQQRQVRTISSAARQQQKENPIKMSSQPPHPALMIPGPVEFDDAVLQAMSHYRLGLFSVDDTASTNN
jgi:alanine-glyoxylate transaminase / serine-glyoxylate transaminase / serine-pyruvate transaminase